MVGSPPENCTTRPSTGRSLRKVLNMPRIMLKARFIQVTGDICIGETHGTRKVAAVRQIDVGQRGVRGVHAAQPAIVRASYPSFDLRVREAKVIAEVPFLHLEVELNVAEDDVAEMPVLGTLLLHHYIAGVGEDARRDDLGALRDKATLSAWVDLSAAA